MSTIKAKYALIYIQFWAGLMPLVVLSLTWSSPRWGLKWGVTARYTASHTKTSYQRGNPCHDQAGNRTTRRPPDHRKETQIEVAWTCFLLIGSGQNHLVRHSERRKKTRQTEEEVGRQHRGMDGPGVRQVPEGSGKHRIMKGTGYEVICGAPTTLSVKGQVKVKFDANYFT